MSFSLTTSIANVPAINYKRIKDGIMGSDYSLSLVFIGDRKSRTLNYTYRRKSYIPNVLSFPLSKDQGEIFINPLQAKREAKDRGMTLKTYIAFLFIHGLLHLEGYRHGDKMDTAELKYLKQFGFR